MPAILVTGVVVLWSGIASAQPKPKGNVQTATVGNRVYSVNRLGSGTYLVTLISTNGVIEIAPINYTFNQSGSLAEFGDSAKIAQLKIDLPNMNVSFT